MPIIRKENNSFGMENEQKSNFNIENDESVNQDNIVNAKSMVKNLIDPEISENFSHEEDQTDDVIISKTDDFLAKAAKSMAKMGLAQIPKIEQTDDVMISRMASSMAQMTEASLHRFEQEEDARISKMIESLALMTEVTIREFEQTCEPYVLALKQSRLIEQLKQV